MYQSLKGHVVILLLTLRNSYTTATFSNLYSYDDVQW